MPPELPDTTPEYEVTAPLPSWPRGSGQVRQDPLFKNLYKIQGPPQIEVIRGSDGSSTLLITALRAL